MTEGFTNSVVGGTTLVRLAIKSLNFIAGLSGWSINRDGSAQFNNVVIRNGTVVSGTALYYSGTPAAGNLVASISATAGTDSFGNAYRAGIVSYGASNFSQIVNGFYESGAFADFAPMELIGSAGQVNLNSGAQTNVDSQLLLRLFSKLASPNSVIQALLSQQAGSPAPATAALLEVQGSAVTDGGVWPLAATPSGTPPAGAEGWNSLGGLTGFTVQAGRYRLTTANEVQLDIEVTAGGANAASVSFANSLPAAYSPLVARHLPLASTRNVTAADPWPRLSVGATGVISVLSAANTTANLGTNVRIPLD